MQKSFEFKSRYDINDLLSIMDILRSPGGCDWDAAQTHESIKMNFIEETYEVVEAINKDDPAMLREELGDVLLQVVFHSRMESETGSFSFGDVCDDICKKLIVRHPHVFGNVEVHGVSDILNNWDDIKRRTKNQATVSDAMESVPKELPALMRAQKLQKKAAKVGFDWDDVGGALAKCREETDELEEAIASGDKARMTDELGDLIFSAVNVARFIGCESEEALMSSSDKFLGRFKSVEALAREKQLDMKTASIKQLDELWEIAKLM